MNHISAPNWPLCVSPLLAPPVPDPPVTGNLAGRAPERFTEVEFGGGAGEHKQPSILAEAIVLTGGDRQNTYGHPKDNWGRTAEIASALLGFELTPVQCVQVAVAMKLARLRQTPGHRDSLVDLAGYAFVWSEVEG